MKKEEFLLKFKEVYQKISERANEDSEKLYISVDPDYDMDYGVDGMGNIVIDRESTYFPVARLLSIKYRIGDGQSENSISDTLLHIHDVNYGTYMLLTFEDEVKLYIVWGGYNPTPMYRRRGLNIGYEGHVWNDSISHNIIKAMRRGWGGWWEEVSDFIIDRGNLIAYKGCGGIVSIPEGVKKICEGAFRNSNIDSVIMASTVEVIEREAFSANFALV